RELIAVVLNSNASIADASALMDYGFGKLASPALIVESQPRPVNGDRLGRLITTLTAQPRMPALDRAYLRAALRPELGTFARDPAAQAGPDSVYDRLVRPAATAQH